jgi:hypothetical protein
MAPAPQLAVAAKPAKQHKPLPAPNSDFYELYETLNAEELATVKRVRTFMEAKVAPVITKYWVDDGGLWSLWRRFGMVTHRWWGNKFCTRSCIGAYLHEIGLDRAAIARGSA